MMTATVDQYYLHVGEGLDSDIVNEGPVFSPTSDNEIGKIISYSSKTGFAMIQLYYKANYKDLLRSGIPLEHIVFKNVA